jgi:hypothetical protein
MKKRCAVAVVALITGCAGSPGEAVRPKDPTYAGAIGEGKPAICQKVGSQGTPLIVDWKPEDRGDLEIAMKQGVAIVHYDCDSVKLLASCKVEGQYPFAGISRKEQVISLASADEAKANLPFNGGQLGASIQRGSTLNIGLMMIGKSSTTVDQLDKSALSGSCDGATHFVRSATLGAFAMKTATVGSVKAAAQVFAIGASGSSDSNRSVSESDGDVDSCKKSNPDAKDPPGDCRALLRIQLVAIGEKASDQTGDVACPPGFVAADGKCVTPYPNGPHECDPNQGDCDKMCDGGNVNSCLTWGEYLLQAPEEAQQLSAFQRACNLGSGEGCAWAGKILLDNDAKKAADLLKTGCYGGYAQGCTWLGDANHDGTVSKDASEAEKYYRRGCDLGDEFGCQSLGDLLADSDPAGSFAAYKMGCASGQPVSCNNVGKAFDSGKGVTADPDMAKHYHDLACSLQHKYCK